jgi:hypothetical protein
VERSGIGALQSVLHAQFTVRSRVLKARMGLAVLRRVLDTGGCHDSAQLRSRLEAVEANAHEFVEVRTLNALRTGEIDAPAGSFEELERLLGGSGHNHASRLGQPDDASPEVLVAAANSALARWQRRAEHPLSSRTDRSTARVATRTLEGILADLAEAG